MGFSSPVRSAGAWLLAVWVAVWVAGCPSEIPEPARRTKGSAGAEVFRLFCKRIAAQAYPNDLSGVRFEPACEGQPGALLPTPESAVLDAHDRDRLQALVERRPALVQALDQVLESPAYQPDELRIFLGEMLPLYDPPEEVLPAATRALAALLQDLLDRDSAVSAAALQALERMAARAGYRPLRQALGVLRPALAWQGLEALARQTLGSLGPEGEARDVWRRVLEAGALDLADADTIPPPAAEQTTLRLARDLLLQQDEVYSAAGAPLWLVRRDGRGVALPTLVDGALPAPFLDGDSDGQADLDARGRYLLTQGAGLPSPFPTTGEATTQRDSEGRALNAFVPGASCEGDGSCSGTGEPPLLYAYLDADRTLLAGVVRDLSPLFDPPQGASAREAPVYGLTVGLRALLGPWGARSTRIGARDHAYQGPDTAQGPLFDLVHALGVVLALESTGPLLETLRVVLRDHESELAGLLEAALYVAERSEAYPDASWQSGHDFWDDLILFSRRMTQRPGMLEAVLRSLGTEQVVSAGPLFGNFMRYRDPVNYLEGSQRALLARGIDMPDVLGNLSDDAVSDAVADHRSLVNTPCELPPGELLGATDSDPGCVPRAEPPAAHHRGIRSCPAEAPVEGAGCGDMTGPGLCSYDSGSCVCDCRGGLCAKAEDPSWRCGLPATRGYDRWVDRGQPDLGPAPDRDSNQSLFQRTAALVHDLHGPAKLCNVEGAELKIYSPAGGNDESALGGLIGSPLAGALLSVPEGTLGPYAACDLLEEKQIVQFFSRAILGTGVLDLRNPDLDRLFDDLLPTFGLDKNQLMERQSQLRGLYVQGIQPSAIARLVFSPFNSFSEGLLALPTTRDGVPVVDRHRDTIIAWEVEDPIAGYSFYEALTPLLQAMENNELRDAEGELTDGYLFGDLISILHRHWSSPASDTTARVCDDTASPPVCDATADRFALQSGGVRYEELLAEALVDARLMERVAGLLRALDSIEIAPGVDGLTVLARGITELLDPASICGEQCEARPLRYRDGRVDSRTGSGESIAQAAPLHLVLDALNAFDATFAREEHAARLTPWRAARSEVVDLLFDVQRDAPGEWRMARPRVHQALQSALDMVTARIAHYRAADPDCQVGRGVGCPALRQWALSLTPRLESSLGSPLVAGTLELADTLWGLESGGSEQLMELLAYLVREQGEEEAFATTVVSLVDLLQLLEDSASVGPLMNWLSAGLSPGAAAAALDPGVALEVEGGALERQMELLRRLLDSSGAAADEAGTMGRLLRELVAARDAQGSTALEVVLDAIVEVNRARPLEDGGRSLDAADLRAVFGEARAFLADERQGLERLFGIIQERER